MTLLFVLAALILTVAFVVRVAEGRRVAERLPVRIRESRITRRR
ncbi:MAG TPA: hypothetical protein VFT66_19100 [Roseiflexaceae bacterium]|nr:hypothetical protein [Roseiflexaceae bacterium]